MANTYTKILSATISSSGQNISVTNIPQTFNDLVVHISGRTDFGGAIGNLAMWFNNDGGSLYSVTNLSGSGATASSSRGSGGFPQGIGNVNSAPTTANVYTSSSIYIPNYSNTSNFKTATVETVTENNSGTAYASMHGFLYRSTNAIQHMAFNGNQVTLGFLAPTSLTIYGVKTVA
jgi:hypothetical protein